MLEGKYFSKPHLMITDAFNANYKQSRRRDRDEQLMSMFPLKMSTHITVTIYSQFTLFLRSQDLDLGFYFCKFLNTCVIKNSNINNVSLISLQMNKKVHSATLEIHGQKLGINL